MFKTATLDGVSFPTAFDGMIVYNTGTGATLTGTNNPSTSTTVTPGIYFFSNPGSSTSVSGGSWVKIKNLATLPSTNGEAIVSSYSCTAGTTGVMKVGVPVSNITVTQTITANVIAVGTYNISATNNGITFSAVGVFTATGPQNIVLRATGTPTAVGTFTYALNTSPNCSFIRDFVYPSTNGTSVVSSYDCSTLSTGNTIYGVAVSGVSQTITATVTTVGTYNISTSAVNGITFSASGSFTSTGPQTIVLTATGTPAIYGNFIFTLNTTPFCSFIRKSICGAFIAPGVFKEFYCVNLPRPFFVDINVISTLTSGDYYQYGKASSAGQLCCIVGIWSSTAQPITNWSDTVKTAFDPCPQGYKVPSIAQWAAVVANNTFTRTGPFTTSTTVVNSGIYFGPNASSKYLTLPASGTRASAAGALTLVNSSGSYWSAGGSANVLFFNNTTITTTTTPNRATGCSVRCVAE